MESEDTERLKMKNLDLIQGDSLQAEPAMARQSMPVQPRVKKSNNYRKLDERIQDYYNVIKSKKFKECEYKFGNAISDNGHVQVFKFHLCGSNG